MLTLTRKEGQSVIIELQNGDTITVFVKHLSKSGAKISFACDKSIHIRRGELEKKDTKNGRDN